MTAEGKAVLVTGCSSGLGKFTAEILRRKGWRVLATARKQADVARLREEGYESFLLDLSSSPSITEAAESALTLTQGNLHGVVNNAGVEFFGAVEDLSRDDLRFCFEVNLFGAIELTNRLIPAFRQRRFGRIVFVSASNSNGFGYPFLGPGNASKGALEIFATTLNRELRHTGISVSTVCPDELSTSLLGNMLAYSRHVFSSPNSVHTDTYSLMQKSFAQAPTGNGADKLAVVAEAIATLLASEKPARRLVVPLSARLHYLAHAILPEWVQDVLLFRKMNQHYGTKL